MRQRLPALVLLCLGLGTTAAFVITSLDTTDAQAAKRRKRPKGHRSQHSTGHRTGGSSRNGRKPLPPVQRTQLLTQCPSDMVNVAGKFCIDRWEASMVDADSGRPLSPYYPPNPRLAILMQQTWQSEFRKELSQSRALMMEAGVMPPRGLGSWDANPASWLDGSTPPENASDAGADASDAGADDADAEARLLVPSADAPHGWVLLGDAGDDARARPVMLLPILPPWQSDGSFRPKAVSRQNVRPQGYTPGFAAEPACRAAGKRLCREDEWVFACKGEHNTKHPYGDRYRQGQCNVFRKEHPGRVLHGNFSNGLSDPRLNMVNDEGDLLLHDTGKTPTCKSEWGADAIYDMVGNVDEWVDDPAGVFVGGFYSRNTRRGCEARVGAHPTVYFDYSTGFRCCADLVGGSSP